MKRLALLLALFLTAKAGAQTADTLVLTTGERRAGRVLAVDAQGFSVEVQIVAGQPPGTMRVPRNQVAHVEFAPDSTRDAFIARGTAAQLPQLAAYWQRLELFLPVAKSPAARLGLRYAGVLLGTKDPANAAKGLALFTRIETDAWNSDDRAAARQGRLRGLIATGQTEAAVKEARELVQTATAPDVLIEAKYILARAADETLRKLVEENPRWEEDDRVRPERHRLYHEALDLYLYPLLFHGARTEAAARGLWQLVALYRFTGEPQLALETARDIASLFPETEPAKPAAAWIATLSAEQRAVDFEKEAKATFAKPTPSDTRQ